MLEKNSPFAMLLLVILIGFSRQCLAQDSACTKIGLSPDNSMRCAAMKSQYELNENMISACKEFSKYDEGKLDCIRSGVSEEAVKFCEGLNFHVAEDALSCLHYANDLVTARICVKISANEENIIQCMKSGRDVGWVQKCVSLPNEMERMHCLHPGRRPAEDREPSSTDP